jgi:ribosome maturation factor RimP
MENYYEHLLAPDGNQEFAKYIIGMLDDLNYGLVRVKINGKKVTNIQIMAENDKHTLSLEDCEILNEVIIDYLEKNEKLFADYSLEISSPGIERPLTRKKDFDTWSDNFVQIKINSDKDFPKKFNAKLLGFSESKIKILIENEKDLNGEYNLDPLMIKEVILSWVDKDPPKPNLIS